MRRCQAAVGRTPDRGQNCRDIKLKHIGILTGGHQTVPPCNVDYSFLSYKPLKYNIVIYLAVEDG